MYYKNVSVSVKTFYGVTFKPGEIKEVKDYINNKFMIPVSEKESKKVAKVNSANSTDEKTSQQTAKQQKPSSEKPKKPESELHELEKDSKPSEEVLVEAHDNEKSNS